MVADLAIRGLATLVDPLEMIIDATTGFPMVTLGRRLTSAEVADALDDE